MIPLCIRHSTTDKIYHPIEKLWIKRSLKMGSLSVIYGVILLILLKLGFYSVVTILGLYAPMLGLSIGVNITGFIVCLIKVPNKKGRNHGNTSFIVRGTNKIDGYVSKRNR